MKSKIFGNGAWLAGVAMVFALFSMCGKAQAVTIQVDYSGSFDVGNLTDEYSFTLFDHAKVDGLFAADGAFVIVNMSLKDSLGNVFATDTANPELIFIFGNIPAKLASFQVADLGPGAYVLSFFGDFPGVNYSGHLTFGPAVAVAVATTPIPGAVLMFMTALGGLGVFGWRRRAAPAT